MMNIVSNELTYDECEEWNRNIQAWNLENQQQCAHEFHNEYFDILFQELTQGQTGSTLSSSNEFLSSPFDTLDDIDTDQLLYQKSFTELTPVKCENMVVDSVMETHVLDTSTTCSNPSVALAVDMAQTSCFLSEFNNDNKNISLNNDSNKISVLNHSNVYGESLHKYTDLIEGDVMVPNVLKSEPCQDSQFNFQADLDMQLPNFTTVNSLSSEYINFETPVYEFECESFETESNASTDSCSSTQERYHPEPEPLTELGEKSSWVKEIKVGKNNRPRGPKCWEFLLRLLRDNASNPSLVKWENPDLGSFKLVEKDKISAIWGNRPSKKKNGKVIKYESFARILRYHYKKGSGMVLPVSEKHLVYKFASEVMAAYRAGKIL